MRMTLLGTDNGLRNADCLPTAQDVGGTVIAVVAIASDPADRHPVAVYLASLAPGSRRTMRQALDVIAGLLSTGTTAMNLRWHQIGYQHAAAVRARLSVSYAPTTANKMLAAMKGVIRQAFALGCEFRANVTTDFAST
jgi:hypothetical protein